MVGPPKKRLKREEQGENAMPQKKYYRQRAHANPFSDHDLVYPVSPSAMDWSKHYPAFVATPSTLPAPPPSSLTSPLPPSPSLPQLTSEVTIADIGCGFGGLLFALSPRVAASTLILGLEIRASVTAFVADKIRALRASSSLPHSSSSDAATPLHSYQNISVLRSNSMKYLPNLFRAHQLEAIFLCFPDPHFKARKHKARIVSAALCAEYAYVLRKGSGRVYTITDVEDLHLWMARHLGEHKLFRRVEEEELKGDEWVRLMMEETEEGKKVARNGGRKFVAVFERVEDPEWV